MNAALEELLGTLLYEGYALYPYTPGATKNATPTPFGIVYPPAYALQTPSTFDKLRMQGVALADGDAVLSGEVRFLQGAGKGHQAVPRRLDAPGRTLADLAAAPHVEPFDVASLHGRVRMAAEDLGEGRWRVLLCVHNTTPVAEGLDRPGALGAQPALDAPGPDHRRRALRLAARVRRRPRASTPSPCSPPTRTTRCSARRSCCPTTRGSRPRAAAISSTAPRSRRRCCCTCSRCPTTSARRSPPPTPPCARWSRAPRPPRPRT